MTEFGLILLCSIGEVHANKKILNPILGVTKAVVVRHVDAHKKKNINF